MQIKVVGLIFETIHTYISLQRLFEEYKNTGLDYELPILLGEDSSGKIKYADLTGFESILMGGQTGSGKSVFIHSIICSLLLRSSSTNCKFVLIDPKRVELTGYNELSHFFEPVIINPKEALYKLKSLVWETNKRLEENISHPYIVLIIDTFSDLFLEDPLRFEESICHIASHSRETNILVIISDSRVGSELYTEKILNSFRTKIAFATPDEESSNCLIGVPDAFNLKGRGDMLLQIDGKKSLTHLQAIFIPDKVIMEVIDHAKKF